MAMNNKIIFKATTISIIIFVLFLLANWRFHIIKDQYLVSNTDFSEITKQFHYNFDDSFTPRFDANVNKGDGVMKITEMYTPILNLNFKDIPNFEKTQSISIANLAKVVNRGKGDFLMTFLIKNKEDKVLDISYKEILIPSEIEKEWNIYYTRFFVNSEFIDVENSIYVFYWNRGKGSYLIDDLSIKIHGVFSDYDELNSSKKNQ